MTATEVLARVYGQACRWWEAGAGSPPVPPPDWTNPEEIFRELQRLGPVRDYLEVGSWLGGSAIRAARAFPDAESIICVDTWLGGAEHWTDRDNPSHDLLRDEATGQPQIFEAFASNMIEAEVAGRIAPVRLPSTVAAEVLSHHGITADVVYVDGSHSYGDVLADCRSYWPLTRRWLMGDDWGDPRFGVAPAVLDFLRIEGVDPRRLQVIGGVFWVVERG